MKTADPFSAYKKSIIIGCGSIAIVLLGALVFSWVAGPDSRELLDTYLRYNPASVQQKKTLLNCVNVRFNADDQFDTACMLSGIMADMTREQQSAFYTRCLAATEPVTLQEISNLVLKRGFTQADIDNYMQSAGNFLPASLGWDSWLKIRNECARRK